MLTIGATWISVRRLPVRVDQVLIICEQKSNNFHCWPRQATMLWSGVGKIDGFVINRIINKLMKNN